MPAASDAHGDESYLAGYGGRWPDVRWPNGARVAVSLVVNLEEGAEFSVREGDASGERGAELVSSVPAGRPDLGMDQHFAYGTRAGYWRVFGALERARCNVTVLACGRAAERLPSLVRRAADAGHEIACHSFRWQNHALIDDIEDERVTLLRAVGALTATVGRRPVGFYGRWGPSPNTRRLLRELGFVYDSNAYDDDLPYFDGWSSDGGPLVVVPYALDTNDWKFFDGDPWGSGSAYLDYLVASLATLISEGERGYPRLLNVGLHPRIVGRPGRAWALERFLAHLSDQRELVWIATRLEIAQFWRRTQAPPPQPGNA